MGRLRGPNRVPRARESSSSVVICRNGKAVARGPRHTHEHLATPMPLSVPPQSTPGPRNDRYVFKAELASGGMGVAWRACVCRGPRATAFPFLQITTLLEDSLARGTRLGPRSRPITYRGATKSATCKPWDDRPPTATAGDPPTCGSWHLCLIAYLRTRPSPGVPRIRSNPLRRGLAILSVFGSDCAPRS